MKFIAQTHPIIPHLSYLLLSGVTQLYQLNLETSDQDLKIMETSSGMCVL